MVSTVCAFVDHFRILFGYRLVNLSTTWLREYHGYTTYHKLELKIAAFKAGKGVRKTRGEARVNSHCTYTRLRERHNLRMN